MTGTNTVIICCNIMHVCIKVRHKSCHVDNKTSLTCSGGVYVTFSTLKKLIANFLNLDVKLVFDYVYFISISTDVVYEHLWLFYQFLYQCQLYKTNIDTQRCY